LDFFGVGLGEVLLVLVLALIIWGPGKIVNVAKTLGKMVHNLKKATSDLTTQITSEAEEKDENASVQKSQPLDK
jgi:sec-independent protein translocase protein TatA